MSAKPTAAMLWRSALWLLPALAVSVGVWMLAVADKDTARAQEVGTSRRTTPVNFIQENAPAAENANVAKLEEAPLNGQSATHIILVDAQVSCIQEVSVPVQETGVLKTVLIREGVSVSEKQLIAQIEDAEVQIEKRKALIELEIARENAENGLRVKLARKSADVLRSELKRSEEAVDKVRTAVSRTEIERLQHAVVEAELKIEQAELDLRLAEMERQLKDAQYALATRSVERRQIKAPFAGVVAEITSRQGQMVQVGEPFCRIMQLDRLRVKGIVRQVDLDKPLLGNPVLFTVPIEGLPDREYQGKVVFVSLEVNNVNGEDTEVWCEVENPDRTLKPGQHGRLVISRTPADQEP